MEIKYLYTYTCRIKPIHSLKKNKIRKKEKLCMRNHYKKAHDPK